MVRCTTACRELLHCTRPSAARPEMRRRTSVATEAKAPSGRARQDPLVGSRGCVRGGQLFSSSRQWLASRRPRQTCPLGAFLQASFAAVHRSHSFLERCLTVHSSFDPWHQIRDRVWRRPRSLPLQTSQNRRPLELAMTPSESEWRSLVAAADKRFTSFSHPSRRGDSVADSRNHHAVAVCHPHRRDGELRLRKLARQPAIQSPKTSGNSAAAPSMAPVSR